MSSCCFDKRQSFPPCIYHFSSGKDWTVKLLVQEDGSSHGGQLLLWGTTLVSFFSCYCNVYEARKGQDIAYKNVAQAE